MEVSKSISELSINWFLSKVNLSLPPLWKFVLTIKIKVIEHREVHISGVFETLRALTGICSLIHPCFCHTICVPRLTSGHDGKSHRVSWSFLELGDVFWMACGFLLSIKWHSEHQASQEVLCFRWATAHPLFACSAPKMYAGDTGKLLPGFCPRLSCG